MLQELLVNAKVRPVGNVTRGTGLVLLPTTAERTERVTIEFPRPTLITGMHSVVTPATFGAFAVDRSAINAIVDVRDDDRRITGTQRQTGQAATSSAVALESLDALVRDHLVVADLGGKGRIALGLTFESRFASAGGSGLTGSILISVDAFGIELTEDAMKALRDAGVIL